MRSRSIRPPPLPKRPTSAQNIIPLHTRATTSLPSYPPTKPDFKEHPSSRPSFLSPHPKTLRPSRSIPNFHTHSAPSTHPYSSQTSSYNEEPPMYKPNPHGTTPSSSPRGSQPPEYHPLSRAASVTSLPFSNYTRPTIMIEGEHSATVYDHCSARGFAQDRSSFSLPTTVIY